MNLNKELFAAVRTERIDRVRWALAAGAHPDASDDAGQTPAFYALALDDHATVRELARWRADLDKHDRVQTLIEAGAGLDIPNGSGDTPLHLAAARPSLVAIDQLTAAGRRNASAGAGKPASRRVLERLSRPARRGSETC